MFSFQFAYPVIIYIGFPIYFLLIFLKLKTKSSFKYAFPLAEYLFDLGLTSGRVKNKIVFFLRALIIFLILLFSARPQWVDVFSKLNVEGIDIVLSLDLSNSMALSDDFKDKRRRVLVAKEEAINFIEKRENDQIGLVVFGGSSLALSPLTLDKSMLKQVVKDLELGAVDPSSTALGRGLASAVLRLRNSDSKSKVIVLLTDGRPSSPDDVPIEKAVAMAKEYGIKVYALGVGGDNPFFIDEYGRYRGPVSAAENSVDVKLLKFISDQTGGKYFHAKNPEQIKAAYQEIDLLEKRKSQTDIFSNYYEAFWLFLIPILILIFFELSLTSFFWRGLSW